MDKKADELIKSVTPKQLEKTRDEILRDLGRSSTDTALSSTFRLTFPKDSNEEEKEVGKEEDGKEGEEDGKEEVGKVEEKVKVENVDEVNDRDEQEIRLAKLDLIQDVQLILVDKYRGGFKLLVTAIIVMVCILSVQILQISRTMSLHGKIIIVQGEQQALLVQQKKMIEEAKESRKEVAQVKIAVIETKKEVKDVANSTPKIEVDPDGKTKVVIPVKKSKSKKDNDKKTDKKSDKKGKPEPPVPALPTQIELRDEF